MLSQNTTAPRRLTDAERRLAPPVGGAWDTARRRVVFADAGDIVVIDTVARTRHQVTRTMTPEAGPRWAWSDTAVTFVSQNNLFVVPLSTGSIEQLTDVKPRRREARDTDSQKFGREQEAALLQYTREAAERRKADEEKRRQDALPEFEITERQSVSQAVLHPSATWAFLVVADRADAKSTIVPNYVTESGYTEDIASRPKVGDVQDYLPAELDLIDTQRGGDATADITTFYSGPRPVTVIFPSIGVDVKRWELNEVRPVSCDTGRLEYRAHTEVSIHAQTTGESTNTMRDLAERYMAAVTRVLLIRKDGLETALDATRFCLKTEPDGDITAVDEEQVSGAMIPSVRIPIAVWMMEGL